jgi:HK97 family phage prohead protease
MSLFSDAAERRAAHVGTRADRPSQRRCAEFTDSPRVALNRAAQLQVRASSSGKGTHFSGYASVVDRGYDMWDMFGPYTEVVTSGAFEKTLAMPGLDVPLVLAHDSLRRMARTTNGSLALVEDKTGLKCDAPDLNPVDVDVAYISPKISDGLIDEMSFAFRIDEGIWSPDFTQFNINCVDIHRGDVAIVGYGANPYTSMSLRSVLDKVQAKRALVPADVSALTQALGWMVAIDAIADEAMESLTAYLGAPNLDPDEPVSELAAQSLEVLRQRETDLRAALHQVGARPVFDLSEL